MQWKAGRKNCFMGAIENQLHVHIYSNNGRLLQMLLGWIYLGKYSNLERMIPITRTYILT